MEAIERGLEALSFRWLIPLAVGMGLAPWPIGPEPHLLAKLRMLGAGALTRPLDIFDLFVHALPSLLLVAKLVHRQVRASPTTD